MVLRVGVNASGMNEENARIKHFNQVSLIFIVAAIPFSLALISMGYANLACIALPCVIAYILCIGLNHRGCYLAAQCFFVTAIAILQL